MQNRLVATTRSDVVRPLAFRGQLVSENWAALRRTLAPLGPSFEFLLAEPVTDPVRGETDWYGDTVGEEAGTPTLLDDFGRMAQQGKALADRLEAASDGASKTLGGLLRLSLTVPAENYVRRGASGPVLVAWGHEVAVPVAEAVELAGRGRVKVNKPPAEPDPPPEIETPPAMAVPTSPDIGPSRPRPPARPGFFGLVGLGTWAMLMALAVLLLAAIVIGPTWSPDACRFPSPVPLVLLALLLAMTGLALSRDPRASWIASRLDLRRTRQLGLGRGAMQIVLAWHDVNDLDLHVLCPDGGHISFEHPSCSGGTLDRDANAQRRDAPPFTSRPLEHVFWTDFPPPGRYRVLVDPYQMRAAPASGFRVTVKLGGRVLMSTRGTATAGQRMASACDFLVPAP